MTGNKPEIDIKNIQAADKLFTFGVENGIIPESFAKQVMTDLKTKAKCPENPEDDLIDMKETQGIAGGVSAVTIYDWVRKGLLTKYKVGTRTRFLRSEVKSLIRKAGDEDPLPWLKGKRGKGGVSNG